MIGRIVGGMSDESTTQETTLPTRPSDVVRQIGVISAVVFMIIAAMVGVGLFGGTAVQDLQGGALDVDASILAPGRPAFSIWSLIYVLTVAYAIWQALPSQRARQRQRTVGWWIALTAVLNGCWLLTAQFLTLPLTVLAIVVLLAALGWTLHLLTTVPGVRFTGVVLMDAAVGLHLGWVALATVANITAWLTFTGPESWAAYAEPVGVAVLIVVGAVGIALAWVTRGRLAPALAMGWGLFWIGSERAAGEPQSTVVSITAFVVAALIVGTAAVLTVFRARAAAD